MAAAAAAASSDSQLRPPRDLADLQGIDDILGYEFNVAFIALFVWGDLGDLACMILVP